MISSKLSNLTEKGVKKMNSKKEGFTLIELIAVIAVIAILALAIVPNIMAYRNKAVVSNGVSAAKTIISAEKTYCADNNKDYNPADATTQLSTLITGDISDTVTQWPDCFGASQATSTINPTIKQLEDLANGTVKYSTSSSSGVNVSGGRITAIH